MSDHYQTLGVARDAAQDEIRAAFRRLAYLHPDQHPGDPTAAKRFAEVTAAYAVLSDPEKRRRYDECPAAPRHVEEVADLVNDIARGARGVDPVRAGMRVLDKVASPEGRREIRGVWQALQGLLR